MKEMGPTGIETGEKASNFKTFGEKDLVIGDRGYCSKQGIAMIKRSASTIPIYFDTISMPSFFICNWIYVLVSADKYSHPLLVRPSYPPLDKVTAYTW
jgi:hypothetical protein